MLLDIRKIPPTDKLLHRSKQIDELQMLVPKSLKKPAYKKTAPGVVKR